uniref:Protein FAM136A n=1 Tax=Strongyloides stercoralis TaxID=6248 RepID=A0A0K0DTZ5_STRER
MEGAQRRMTDSVEKFADEIDRKYLRTIKKAMFDCSSKCFSNKNASRVEIDRCIESCGSSTDAAQRYFNKELETLGQQLNRCVMSAYDKAVQKYGEPKSSDDSRKIQEFMDSRVNTCVDEHLALLPNIEKKFVNDLYNKLK